GGGPSPRDSGPVTCAAGAQAKSQSTEGRLMLRIKSAQDFGAGVMFFLIGLGALWFGREYEVGTAAQMGPGYLPKALGYGLLVFGAIFVLRGVALEGQPI